MPEKRHGREGRHAPPVLWLAVSWLALGVSLLALVVAIWAAVEAGFAVDMVDGLIRVVRLLGE